MYKPVFFFFAQFIRFWYTCATGSK